VDRLLGQGMFKDIRFLNEKLGLAQAVADIERVRRILGVEKVVVLGHSWGGFLASLYAAEFPEHVEGLVLVAPAGVLVFPQPDGSDLFKAMEQRLAEADRPAFRDFMKGYFDIPAVLKMDDAQVQAMNLRQAEYYIKAGGSQTAELLKVMPKDNGGWMVYAQYLSMGLHHDYRPGLRAVTAPVLVMHGGRDIQGESVARLYAAAFPNAQVTVLPAAGHFMFQDEPKAFAATVTAFLAGLKQP